MKMIGYKKVLCCLLFAFALVGSQALVAHSHSSSSTHCPNKQLPPPPIPSSPYPQTSVITPIETCATTLLATPLTFPQCPTATTCLSSLAGKNVLVVGGSRGIGKATAISMAQAGANVVATSRAPAQYPLYPNDLYLPVPYPSTGFVIDSPGKLQLSTTHLDIRFQAAVDEFFDLVVADPNGPFAGHIDILCINPGFAFTGPLIDCYADDMLEFHEVNLWGHLRVLHRAIEYMDANGIIFDVASLEAEGSSAFSGPYPVGKRAQHAYADTWNIENAYLAKFGVVPKPKIVIVEPLFVSTTIGQFDWGKPRTLPESNPLVAESRAGGIALLTNELAVLVSPNLTSQCSFVVGAALTNLAAEPPSAIPGRIVPVSNPPTPLELEVLNVINGLFAIPADDAIALNCLSLKTLLSANYSPPTVDNFTFGTSQTNGDQSVHHVKCYSVDEESHSCKPSKLPRPPFPLQKTNTVDNVPKCNGEGLKLEGRNILVVGASSGIGREIAERLGKAGANVIGTSRNPSKVKPSKYFEMAKKPLDIRFQYSVDEFFDEIVRPLEHIDTLINVAGIQSFGPMADYYADDVIEVWQTNLYGFHRTLRAVLPYTNLDSKLINIGCEYGSEIPGVVGQGAYATAKRALQQYTFVWNLENCLLSGNNPPYPYAPKLILIEPTITSTDLGKFEYAKPETLDTFSKFVQKPRKSFIKAMDKCGASAEEIGLAVLQVVRTPSADVNTRYLVNRKKNCFDQTTQELIDAEWTLPINETNAILNNFYSR